MWRIYFLGTSSSASSNFSAASGEGAFTTSSTGACWTPKSSASLNRGIGYGSWPCGTTRWSSPCSGRGREGPALPSQMNHLLLTLFLSDHTSLLSDHISCPSIFVVVRSHLLFLSEQTFWGPSTRFFVRPVFFCPNTLCLCPSTLCLCPSKPFCPSQTRRARRGVTERG